MPTPPWPHNFHAIATVSATAVAYSSTLASEEAASSNEQVRSEGGEGGEGGERGQDSGGDRGSGGTSAAACRGSDADGHMDAGQTAYRSGDIDVTASIRPPLSPQGMARRGTWRVAPRGRWPAGRGRAIFVRALEAQPDHPNALFEHGSIHLGEHVPEAAELFRRSARPSVFRRKLTPSYRLHNLGNALSDLGRAAESLAAFQTATSAPLPPSCLAQWSLECVRDLETGPGRSTPPPARRDCCQTAGTPTTASGSCCVRSVPRRRQALRRRWRSSRLSRCTPTASARRFKRAAGARRAERGR